MTFRLMMMVALVASTSIFAAADTAAQSKVQTKYWIFLEDKPNSDATFGKREITERAIDRRHKKASTNKADYFDRAVSDDYLNKLQDSGISIEVVSRWLNAVTAHLSDEQASEVQRLSFVSAIRPVGVSVESTAPSAPLVYEQLVAPLDKKYSIDYGPSFTQLDVINAVTPLEQGINGTGVRIGILDTEFENFNHEVFADMVADNRLIDYQNFTQGSQTSRHGFFVASIMVGFKEGQLVGPGYGAELVAATTEFAPTETNQEEDDWVAGLEWLESMGVDVVNSSLAYSEFDAGENSYTIADLDGDTGITTIAADIAASLGVVVVNSAGNDGGCANPTQCWFYILTPADGDSVIAVGSVNSSGSKSGFSSFGPTADDRIKPDVSAMGEGTYFATTAGTSSYASGNGTSFSSPAVAGVVAQILQVNPDLTPAEVSDILKETASQGSSPDTLIGYGIINSEAAILRATPVGVETDPIESSLSVVAYPNPAESDLSFKITGASVAGLGEIAIYDILGRRVETAWTGYVSGETTTPEINLNLPAGLYVYRFEGDAGFHSGTVILVN